MHFAWLSLKSLPFLWDPLVERPLPAIFAHYTQFPLWYGEYFVWKRLKKIFWEKNRGIIPHDSFVTAYQFFWWSMQGANTWITGHERVGWGAGDFPSIVFRRQSSTKFTWILFLPLIFDINYSWVIINLNFPLCTFVLVELSGAPHKHAF